MVIDVLLPGFPGKSDRGFLGWCTVLALRTQGSIIVIDTGSFGDRPMLLEALAAKGIAPLTVNKVMITHLHFDHCLNTDIFPKAELLISAKEWEYAYAGSSSAQKDPFIPRTCLPYIASRRPTLVEEGHVLSESCKIVELPGHTPGCIGLFCEQEGLLVAGDAVKNARDFHFRDPGICFDSQATGVASMERAARLAKKIIPGHDSQFSLVSGGITRQTTPSVTVTDFADWTNAVGITHVLPER